MIRNLLSFTALALALGATAHAQAPAPAAAFPTKPIRLIVPFPPGGGTDILSRIWCAKMSEITGQQFIVENRSGNGGNVGTEAIARNNTYPTAMVMVFKLDGSFDVPAALKHADADAELSKGFTKLNFSTDDFQGFPSSMIEGSYDLNGTRVHTYNRVVIPVTGAPDFHRYLVQFTVTGLADQAAAQAPEVQKVIDGFSVAVK